MKGLQLPMDCSKQGRVVLAVVCLLTLMPVLMINMALLLMLQILSLWLHETSRVFEDRLTCTEDHEWFRQHQVSLLQKHFALSYSQVVHQERLIYGDYLIPGAEPRVRLSYHN